MGNFQLNNYFTAQMELNAQGAELVIQYLNSQHANLCFPIKQYSYVRFKADSDYYKPKPIYYCLESTSQTKVIIDRLINTISKKDREANDYRKAFIVFIRETPVLFVYIKENGASAIFYFHPNPRPLIEPQPGTKDYPADYATEINQITGLPVYYMVSEDLTNLTHCLLYGRKLTAFDPQTKAYTMANLLGTLNNEVNKNLLLYQHKGEKCPPPLIYPRYYPFFKEVADFTSLALTNEDHQITSEFVNIVFNQFYGNSLNTLVQSEDIKLLHQNTDELALPNTLKFMEALDLLIELKTPLVSSHPYRGILSIDEDLLDEELSPSIQRQVEDLLKTPPSYEVFDGINSQEEALLTLIEPPHDTAILTYLLSNPSPNITVEFWFKVSLKSTQLANLILANKAFIEINLKNDLYYFAHRDPYLAEKVLALYPHLLQQDERKALEFNVASSYQEIDLDDDQLDRKMDSQCTLS